MFQPSFLVMQDFATIHSISTHPIRGPRAPRVRAGSALVSPALPALLIRYAPPGRTGALMGSLGSREGYVGDV